MTLSDRVLRWLYLAAASFTAHCSVTSARADAWWYAIALFGVVLLLAVAVAREYAAAHERRAAAVRAERAARLRAWSSQARADLEDGCCERWWTSTGTAHDHTCTNYEHQRRTA
ncbi:hypothetical protein ACIQMV_18875 [Streptomyces sp. NPDC091412]|uniref:hypothetical protein n=1 Tax=Streptomyces sp. NPDC091412 TaxID=3366002 RepID=UPI003807B15C